MRALRSHGVTLVELLVVITILGIVAVVAVPDFRSVSPNQLELAAKEFAGAMRFARSESIRTGAPHGFTLSTTLRQIQVYQADMGTTPPTPIYDVYHPVRKQLYDIDLDTHPLARVDGVTGTANFQGTCNSPGQYLFNASGTPYCRDPDTVAYLSGNLVFSFGGHTRTLTLDGITGRVTVQ